MKTFSDLAAARIDWIESVLKPWCKVAVRAELIKAELEWLNIAGKVDANSTLWTWAWSRFPELVHDGLAGVNETHRVCVFTSDENKLYGFPNERETVQGILSLLTERLDATGNAVFEEVSIDDIRAVKRLDTEI